MELTLSAIPEKEALRYLGVKGDVPPALLEQVQDACRALLPHCRVRYTWRLTHKAALGEILTGEDLPTLLRHCDRAVVMAVTLGMEAEALIRRAGLTSPTRALVLDACASAACEAACDELQTQLEGQLCREGVFPTDRFSPGYGDLPLEVQRPLLDLLDGQRACGITLSDTFIMSPRKSVTAIFGLAGRPQGKRARGCAFCSMNQNCSFRKAGITCA